MSTRRHTAHRNPDEAPAQRPIAPLRVVTRVSVSEKSGQALNPHYFWLTWEFTLMLECGHSQVRARCVFEGRAADIDKLDPPLPSRVRCTTCPPKLVTRIRARKEKPSPRFDPVVGALIAATCKGAPAREEELLDWVSRHGRFVQDPVLRARAYGAMALVAIEAYLPETTNPHVQHIQAAVKAWADKPTAVTRAAVRRNCLRLYGSQERHGSWFAHRGILDAAKLTSPAPHNIEAALSCPTWDDTTRGAFYGQLWSLRHEHDRERAGETAAFLDDDGDGVREHAILADELGAELTRAVENDQPTISELHGPFVAAMLDAYRRAVEHGQRTESGDGVPVEATS